MALSTDTLEKFLALQADEATFRARKSGFLASLASIEDRMGDCVLASLLADEESLRERRRDLCGAVKGQLGLS